MSMPSLRRSDKLPAIKKEKKLPEVLSKEECKKMFKASRQSDLLYCKYFTEASDR